eukprot:1141323-Pelagomonas_calceolata.AAC.3
MRQWIAKIARARSSVFPQLMGMPRRSRPQEAASPRSQVCRLTLRFKGARAMFNYPWPDGGRWVLKLA